MPYIYMAAKAKTVKKEAKIQALRRDLHRKVTLSDLHRSLENANKNLEKNPQTP